MSITERIAQKRQVNAAAIPTMQRNVTIERRTRTPVSRPTVGSVPVVLPGKPVTRANSSEVVTCAA